MFEKDAEEYATGIERKASREIVYFAFKDGAEFGYNKCFEQIRKLVNEHTRLDCIIPELLRLKESE